MIACIIEFGIRPGMEEPHQKELAPLLEAVEEVPGFISKETFDSRNTPGKLVTISYWQDEEAMRRWMRDKQHMQAINKGRRKIFTHYKIQISEVAREYGWESTS